MGDSWTLKSGESLTIDWALTPTFCQVANYEQPESDWFSWVEYGYRAWPSFCSWIVCANEPRTDVIRQVKLPPVTP